MMSRRHETYKRREVVENEDEDDGFLWVIHLCLSKFSLSFLI